MNSAVVVFVAILGLISCKTITLTYTDCGGSTSHGHVTSFTYAPNPGVSGAPIAITAGGNVNEAVTGGTFKFDVFLSGIAVFHHEHSVCGSDSVDLPLGLGHLDLNLLSCPVSSGPITLKIGLTVSDSVPSGDVILKATATDSAGGALLCLDVTSHIA
eukprot:NODE_8749_length_649_cov_188.517110_g8124_i0.p1 GENE.NODE_8749_length_649_cov_188.517110_g8124_i0~~NODE_8749_length_649_cov_188.517110_g8124_i0.p1  ORF type:complete len:158 (+),score=27.42 NODE_8749_length_649_cov_188.517110_g8124_i0:66-539(+)